MLVIVNPAAGQGSAEAIIDAIETSLGDRGLDAEIRRTRGEGDAAEWTAASLGQVERVVVAGGDGTIREALGAMAGRESDTRLGVIPAGTANILAHALELPTDLDEAVAVALCSSAQQQHDLGFILPFERHFAIMAAIGFPAHMIEIMSRQQKDRLGLLAYVVAAVRGLWHLRRLPARIRHDGRELETAVAAVSLLNLGTASMDRIFSASARGHPGDGRLDLSVFVSPGPLRAIGAVLSALLRGAPSFDLALQELVREVEITGVRGELPVMVDGDFLGHTPVTIRVVPRAVRLVVPEPGEG